MKFYVTEKSWKKKEKSLPKEKKKEKELGGVKLYKGKNYTTTKLQRPKGVISLIDTRAVCFDSDNLTAEFLNIDGTMNRVEEDGRRRSNVRESSNSIHQENCIVTC